MSDNLPWKTWTPDDLAPPQAEFVPMVEPEETIIEEAEPSLEQQLAQLQMQAHEQGYQAGLPKVASKVMSRAIRKDWPRAGARSGRGEVSTSANSCPDAATGQRISNYP